MSFQEPELQATVPADVSYDLVGPMAHLHIDGHCDDSFPMYPPFEASPCWDAAGGLGGYYTAPAAAACHCATCNLWFNNSREVLEHFRDDYVHAGSPEAEEAAQVLYFQDMAFAYPPSFDHPPGPWSGFDMYPPPHPSPPEAMSSWYSADCMEPHCMEQHCMDPHCFMPPASELYTASDAASSISAIEEALVSPTACQPAVTGPLGTAGAAAGVAASAGAAAGAFNGRGGRGGKPRKMHVLPPHTPGRNNSNGNSRHGGGKQGGSGSRRDGAAGPAAAAAPQPKPPCALQPEEFDAAFPPLSSGGSTAATTQAAGAVARRWVAPANGKKLSAAAAEWQPSASPPAQHDQQTAAAAATQGTEAGALPAAAPASGAVVAEGTDMVKVGASESAPAAPATPPKVVLRADAPAWAPTAAACN